jgi:hypothetical protein
MGFVWGYISSSDISHDSSLIARIDGNVCILFFLILDKDFREHSRVSIGENN